MSDSVVKLRIDSKEYDANIKRAGEALTQYFNRVREGGGTLEHLDEGVLEAVKAMGELGTKADSTRGALRELTQATADMLAQYRGLTDAEKATPLGAAMAESISQMTERAGVMRDAMDDVSASIQHAASDTRGFDQIAGGISLMTSGFQTAIGAANLLGIEMGNQEKVLATLASAMSITNGLQTAQNLLQSQSALMMGVQAAQASVAAAAQTALAAATGSATIAQKAFNVVANANPYVLLATAVAAVGTALYAFASASDKAEKEAEELAKAEEEAQKKADDARNAFVNASAEAMNSASRLSSLQVAYKNANSEIEKTNILKQAQQEFKKLGIECKGVDDAQTLLVKNGGKIIELIQLQGNAAAIAAVRMEKFKESFKMLMENGYSAGAAATLAGYNKDVQELDGQLNTMQGKIQNLKSGLGVGGNGGGTNKPTKPSPSSTEQDPVAGSIAEQEKRLQSLQTAWKNAADDDSRARIKEQIDLVQETLDHLTGKDIKPIELQIDTQFPDLSTQNFNTSSFDLGQQLMNKVTQDMASAAQEADYTTITEFVKFGIEQGVDSSVMTGIGQKLAQSILNPDDIDPADMEDFLATMKEDLQGVIDEQDWPKIKLAIETGDMKTIQEYQKKVQDSSKKTEEGWKEATGAIGQLGNALNGIEDPTAKVFGTVLQGIAGVAAGFGNAAKGPFNSPWEYIAFAASGIAAMISAITAIHSATGFANGGIVKAAEGTFVPGNNMSGDLVPAMLNSGELVLNRAQQGNLASQLEGGGLGNLQLDTFITGEQIRFVLNNNGRRTGRGEYVQSNRR